MPALADVLDVLLEVSIVGSFGRPGYLVRRARFEWPDPLPAALDGRTVLVTGPTSGLGRATAESMASLGARVVLVGRSSERLERVRSDLIARHGEDRFPSVVTDMSSLASVRGAVGEVLATEPRLDVLVDNAGAIYPERTLTAEGLEATFATMVAGPFVLVAGLLPLLEASGDGRVITVASGGMYAQRLPLDDLQYERGRYDGTLAYARAKRASVALIREWASRSEGAVRFDAMHPGWVDTPGLAEQLPGFHRLMDPILRTPEEGIDTIIWLATERDPGRPDGRFYLDRRPRPFDRLRATRLSRAARRRLWDLVAELTATADPAPELARAA